MASSAFTSDFLSRSVCGLSSSRISSAVSGSAARRSTCRSLHRAAWAILRVGAPATLPLATIDRRAALLALVPFPGIYSTNAFAIARISAAIAARLMRRMCVSSSAKQNSRVAESTTRRASGFVSHRATPIASCASIRAAAVMASYSFLVAYCPRMLRARCLPFEGDASRA
jgi:hypothetical protein